MTIFSVLIINRLIRTVGTYSFFPKSRFPPNESSFDLIRLQEGRGFYKKIERMETIGQFTDFLRRAGSTNFLAIGIVIVLLWLLISGLVKGLRKKKHHHGPDGNEEDD